MKYNGIELEPITEPQIFDPPKEMLVWDSENDTPIVRRVWGIAPKEAHDTYPVRCINPTGYRYCAEIPQTKSKRATYLQLAEWLAKGNGTWKLNSTKFADIGFSLHIDEEKRELEEGKFLIRPFGTTEWLESTLENMGMEDK